MGGLAEPDGAPRLVARLSDILDAALCSADLALFGAGAPAMVRRVCRALPDVANEAGIEVRLAGGTRQVDVGVRLEPSASFLLTWRAFATRTRDGGGLSRAWSGFDAFVARWSSAGSLVARWVPFVFLEVDGVPAIEVTPSIFVSFDWPLVDAAGWPEETARSCAVACEALQLLGADLREHAPRIRDCFAALPFEGRIVHVGAMLGRRGAPIRLSVAVSRDDFDGYARDIGILAAGRLRERINKLCPELNRIHLEYDIGSADPKLGLIVAATLAESGSADVVAGVLERCRALRLCSGERVQGVLSWPATVVQRRGAGPRWLLRRFISHIKLGLLPGEVPELKAYLAASLDAY